MAAPYWRMSDSDLVIWSNNFSAHLTAAPGDFSITTAQAAEFATLSEAFAAAVSTWRNNATRTPVASKNKTTARENLKAMAKYLVNSINSNPVTINSQRDHLGIPIRKKPTPNPVPSSAPIIDVASVVGRVVTIGLRASEISKRGKPAGVKGASVFSFVGAQPPSDSTMWKFEGLITKTKFEINFGDSTDANTAWISVNWYNERGETGVGSAPASVNLPANKVMPAVRVIKIAA